MSLTCKPVTVKKTRHFSQKKLWIRKLRIKISLTCKPVITAKKRNIFGEKNLRFLNSNLVKTCQTKLN